MMFKSYTFKLLKDGIVFAVLNCPEEVFFDSLKLTYEGNPNLSFDGVSCVVTDIMDGDNFRHTEEYLYCEDFSKFASCKSFRDFLSSPECHGVPFIPGASQKCPFVEELFCTAKKPDDCQYCSTNPDFVPEFEEIPHDDT